MSDNIGLAYMLELAGQALKGANEHIAELLNEIERLKSPSE